MEVKPLHEQIIEKKIKSLLGDKDPDLNCIVALDLIPTSEETKRALIEQIRTNNKLKAEIYQREMPNKIGGVEEGVNKPIYPYYGE